MLYVAVEVPVILVILSVKLYVVVAVTLEQYPRIIPSLSISNPLGKFPDIKDIATSTVGSGFVYCT